MSKPGIAIEPEHCGDDAYYGFGGATIESAVEHIIADTIKARERHGGKNWRPSKDFAI